MLSLNTNQDLAVWISSTNIDSSSKSWRSWTSKEMEELFNSSIAFGINSASKGCTLDNTYVGSNLSAKSSGELQQVTKKCKTYKEIFL